MTTIASTRPTTQPHVDLLDSCPCGQDLLACNHEHCPRCGVSLEA